MRVKFFKSLSVLMSLILFISVFNFPTLIVKADSGSGVEGFVERCYTVILGRDSDPDGLIYWTEALKNGERVGTNVAYGFVFSKEYADRNRTNEEFVNDMYSLVLDREADEGGYEYWCSKLENGETRQQVYGGFVNSPEFYGICQQYGITAGYFLAEYDYMQVNNVNLFVDRLYRTCLGRPGDQGGQEYWVRALINNEITGIKCAAGFVNSNEYRNNGLSNEDYVENMYSACLGRQSEPNGKAYWVNALEKGMTRDELFSGFANSDELGNICAEYGIIRGDYTPTEIGTFDPSNPNNTPNPDHTHNYSQKNTDSKYLKSAATCTEAAVYYMSCECGEYDENNTFTSGSPLGHAWDDGTITKEATATEEGIKTYHCKHDGCKETKTETIPNKLNNLKIGDKLKFGNYEQDGDESNGQEDIEWQVLSVEEDRILVISEYGLDYQEYDKNTVSGNNTLTWETSSLRKWLNSDFFKAAFSDNEKSKIQTVTLKNNDNSKYGTLGGNNTEDKVFCLSHEEVEKYYGDIIDGYSQSLLCTPTQYAIDKGAYYKSYNGDKTIITVSEAAYNDGTYVTGIYIMPLDGLKSVGYTSDVIGRSCYSWWLRSPGTRQDSACVIRDIGCENDYTSSRVYEKLAVRPAMYIQYNPESKEHTHSFNCKVVNDKYLKKGATCTEPSEYYMVCRCGEIGKEKSFPYGVALGHIVDGGTVTKEATLTEKGEKIYACQREGCDESYTKSFNYVLSFGKYEQDGDESNGKEDIEWEVLSIEENRILVVSKYALDCKPYNTEDTEVTWETCSLRGWLNNEFMNTAFSDKEKSKIQTVTLKNKDNTKFGTAGGKDTKDKVFCLSLEEIEKYFGDYNIYYSDLMYGGNQNSICVPTQYAINNGIYAYAVSEYEYNNYYKEDGYTPDVIGQRGCSWWLRSPGETSRETCRVSNLGFMGAGYHNGYVYNTYYNAVRPAMYIEY